MFRLATALMLALTIPACIDDATASDSQDSTAARGSAGSGGSGDCRPPMPPPEAFAACANLTAGDACAFDIDSHHITGTCRQPEPSAPLGCAPDHPPPPPGQPPR